MQETQHLITRAKRQIYYQLKNLTTKLATKRLKIVICRLLVLTVFVKLKKKPRKYSQQTPYKKYPTWPPEAKAIFDADANFLRHGRVDFQFEGKTFFAIAEDMLHEEPHDLKESRKLNSFVAVQKIIVYEKQAVSPTKAKDNTSPVISPRTPKTYDPTTKTEFSLVHNKSWVIKKFHKANKKLAQFELDRLKKAGREFAPPKEAGVFEIETFPNDVFFNMPLVPGASLFKFLEDVKFPIKLVKYLVDPKNKDLSFDAKSSYIRSVIKRYKVLLKKKVAEQVVFLHEKANIAHGDLHWGNIMVVVSAEKQAELLQCDDFDELNEKIKDLEFRWIDFVSYSVKEMWSSGDLNIDDVELMRLVDLKLKEQDLAVIESEFEEYLDEGFIKGLLKPFMKKRLL